MKEMTYEEMKKIHGGAEAEIERISDEDLCTAVGIGSSMIVSFFATPIGGALWAWGYYKYVKC